jgi:hypothetical protein
MDLDNLQAVLTSKVMHSGRLALQNNFNCKNIPLKYQIVKKVQNLIYAPCCLKAVMHQMPIWFKNLGTK